MLDSLFLEQFEKSGYNSVKCALSVVSKLMWFIIHVIIIIAKLIIMINLQEQLTSTNILFIPVNTDKIHWSLIVSQLSYYGYYGVYYERTPRWCI